MLVVEMLSTGDEVLHGQIIDTNAAWLADCFFQQGIPLSSRTTVGDSLDSLVSVLLERSCHADVLIVNGGLGPTSDDLSALAAATAAGVPLIEHQEWITIMEDYFASRGRAMAASNRKQAMLPQHAELIDNPVGTACGFCLLINDCWLFFTPGVPSEFKVMITEQIIPRLRRRYILPEPPVCLRLTSFGRSESSLAQQFDSLTLPTDCVMGYRSSAPTIELKLTGPAIQQQEMLKVWQKIKAEVGDNCVFEGTEGLASVIGRMLISQQLQVAVSEHFSQGLLSWTLQSAEVPFKGGVVIGGNIAYQDGVHNNSEQKSSMNSGVMIEDKKSGQESQLSMLLARARDIAVSHHAGIGLVIGDYAHGCLSLALYTPEKAYAQQVRYMPQNHSKKTQQDVSVMLLFDMLSRWLTQREVFGNYEWLIPTETLVV
ncbi:nicotinamide mononucleotide deamidase-related protein YfaY [Moellerella wisconsensis]|uniref:nicotinamide mononucleotide deamidase-related protein YfaY n=1 Tax=Moellerella wisconsensis TaxID=158849 RepID=UPI0030760686